MENKGYRILEHPADVRIQALGKTKEELFLNAMKGMNAVLRPQIRSTKSEIRNIKVKSVDANALLVDFLNEVLYLIQTNKEIYNNIKFTKFSDAELEGKLSGDKVESFNEDIKAATHHDLKIDLPIGSAGQKNSPYEATILFDI